MTQLRERDFMSQLWGFVLNNQSLGRNQRLKGSDTQGRVYFRVLLLKASMHLWHKVIKFEWPSRLTSVLLLSWCWFKVSASLRKKPLWMLVAPAAAAAFFLSVEVKPCWTKQSCSLSTTFNLLKTSQAPPPLPPPPTKFQNNFRLNFVLCFLFSFECCHLFFL